MYNDAYDEGYRAGMQKMREVGGQRIKELEAALLAAEELVAILAESDHAINWSFSAGTEEREGGSGRRQGKLDDKVRDWKDRRRAALADYRKATEVSSE